MPEQMTIITLTLIFIFFLIYPFIIYPLVLSIIAKIFNKPVSGSADVQPNLNVVISAYNEEKLIVDAVRSVFRSGYPYDKIALFVGSDGSSDKTVEILNNLRIEFPNLQVFDFPRSGKNYVLNKLVQNCESDIIVYLDADCRIVPHSLDKMAFIFADKTVGAVIAAIEQLNEFQNDNVGRTGEMLYQKFEKLMRISESKIHSTVNSLGAMYAIRKENYNPLPSDFVCDDYMPILDTCLNRQRVIFDETIIVNEVREKSLSDELSRRVRVGAGGMEAVFHSKRLLSPSYGWTSFFLWSHKVLRWMSPFFLIGILIFTFLLENGSVLKNFLLIAQSIFYISAFFGWIFEKFNKSFILFRISLFFLMMIIGFLLAFIRFIGKKQSSKWERH